MAVKSKGFSEESFEPVSEDGPSDRFADGNAEARKAASIFGHTNGEKLIVGTKPSSEDGSKVGAGEQPYALGKRELLHFLFSLLRVTCRPAEVKNQS